jgi:hypothetical protein
VKNGQGPVTVDSPAFPGQPDAMNVENFDAELSAMKNGECYKGPDDRKSTILTANSQKTNPCESSYSKSVTTRVTEKKSRLHLSEKKETRRVTEHTNTNSERDEPKNLPDLYRLPLSTFSTFSKKEKLSILLSKISREKQSIWSIRDFEEVFITTHEESNQERPRIFPELPEKPTDIGTINREYKEINAYFSPPPPLPNVTKNMLGDSKEVSSNFNLEEQGILYNLNGLEINTKDSKSGPTTRKSIRQKNKKSPVDSKLEEPRELCGGCCIF